MRVGLHGAADLPGFWPACVVPFFKNPRAWPNSHGTKNDLNVTSGYKSLNALRLFKGDDNNSKTGTLLNSLNSICHTHKTGFDLSNIYIRTQSYRSLGGRCDKHRDDKRLKQNSNNVDSYILTYGQLESVFRGEWDESVWIGKTTMCVSTNNIQLAIVDVSRCCTQPTSRASMLFQNDGNWRDQSANHYT